MSLIAHWKCDDNAASTTVVATVGSNATLSGGDNTSAHTVAGPGGIVTLGLSLNGTDDFIDISASAISFLTSTAYSFNCWFKRAGTNFRFIGDPIVGTSRIFGNSDTNINHINAAGTSVNFTVPAMGTTNWHHLLVTRTTGNSARVFLDGTESSSGAQTVSGAMPWAALGKSSNAFTNGGSIAQVKIFDSDESANVATLYAEGVSSGGAVVPIFMNQYRQRWS